jgi:Fe-S-cluster-containing dehydrogenase component
MSIDRRTFLGVAGLSALAIAGESSLLVLAQGAHVQAASGGQTPTRWAMVIDPQKCLKEQGCTDCITACNTAHNIPQFVEPAHQVKWIWKEPFESAFPDQGNQYTNAAFRGVPVPMLCNHCDNPPCTRVCPTGATWKRPDGIVMMDWHRCIGCKYCIVACPYGSRSFNFFDPRTRLQKLNPDFPTREIGVVEKCNFCEERLAKGERPACVEACKEKALVFGNLNDPTSEVRELLRTRFSIRPKPELGTDPETYYLV